MGKEKGRTCQVCTGCGRCLDNSRNIEIITRSFLLEKNGQSLVAAGNVRENSFVLVDLGTTTIAMELYDRYGVKQAEFVRINPQRIYGLDVISRMERASELLIRKQMQSMVREILAEGIQYFLGKDSLIDRMYLAGNTVMIYLLMGFDTKELGTSPFTATHVESCEGEIEGIPFVTVPGISAFVGGDILSGVLACGMSEKEELSLLIDLGTNGEMVLGNRERMIATATAAGPAFEGSGDAWGTDRIRLLAVLRDKEVIDETGLLASEFFEEGVTIEGTLITQEMIRELQLAKAAVAAGISILQEEMELTEPDNIERIYLAGGFGYFLDVDSALEIGLLPLCLKGKIQTVGNLALAGLYKIAMTDRKKPNDKDWVNEMQKIAHEKIHTKNLAMSSKFAEYYIESMNVMPG